MWLNEAGCGWVSMAVGSQLGSQLGYPASRESFAWRRSGQDGAGRDAPAMPATRLRLGMPAAGGAAGPPGRRLALPAAIGRPRRRDEGPTSRSLVAP
jgi:hypothetical protein